MTINIDEAGFMDSELLGADADVASSKWVVLKFGGNNVATVEDWRVIAALVRNRLRAGLRPLVVHSAIAGASNALESILRAAIRGDAEKEIAGLCDTHRRLAASLGLDADILLAEHFVEIQQLAAGVTLLREASPRVHARMLAQGELMSTTLGAAYLNANEVQTDWVDARELMISRDSSQKSNAQNFLSATCEYSPDAALSERLAAHAGVILTQGFIGSNTRGETVLLGREGSDTSAAYFASRLQARRLEIWTDVPGMFSADPRLVPSARLLTELGFDEAQELSTTGSRVLHPRCIGPLRHSGIPLFIRGTSTPKIGGTVVSAAGGNSEPQVKGVSTRREVTLISMQGSVMWHEAGFLAEAFACFAKHGISIDLVSTSQTNVTVAVDNDDQMLAVDAQRALVADLERLCRVRVIPDCAVISLVGQKICTMLPRLAPVLRIFDEEKIHMLSQAANDLNLSFVIDQQQLPKLAGRIHDAVIRSAGGSRVFGPRWDVIHDGVQPVAASRNVWWIRKREQLLNLLDGRSHAYVYDSDTVREAAASLLALKSVDRVLYAMKANFNPGILRLVSDLGVDFECVSPGEVKHLQEVIPGFDNSRILFTPNFAPREEYVWGREQGLQLTLDNLYPLRAWPEVFRGLKLFIRVDPGQGRGHHEHVKTGGVQSKFGVPLFEIDELQDLLERAGADVTGIHAHSGSGILDPENWRSVAATLAGVADRFPNVEVLDLGGGLGVPDHSGESAFDMDALDKTLAEIRTAHPKYRLWLEPGRYLVARSGVLLARVTQVKGKGDMQYVGVSTGMNSLIRPALYGAWHEIVNLSRAAEKATESVTVVGPICETGDKLGVDRMLPPSRENDVIAIANAGAYGRVMSSRYNLREPADELMI